MSSENSQILVSVVIPCYNPGRFLEEALASARAQTHRPVEIVLVNDGTDDPDSLRALRAAASSVTRFIEQPNRGLAAARNAGFQAAAGAFVVPLDADDRLDPAFIAECLAAIQAHPEAAFVYTDYRVFGDSNYVERLGEYNLDRLLDENTLIYASLIRRADWAAAGGYDDTMRTGYEDWDFWLRLAERQRFGHHVAKPLFHYRKHGRSLLTLAREHHQEIAGKIRANHPGLYSRQGRAAVKARWAPAACVLSPRQDITQAIEDWQLLPDADPRRALELSPARAFLVPGAGPVDPHDAELCALAVWGGTSIARLPDGAWAISRDALAKGRPFKSPAKVRPARPQRAALRPPLERLRRHWVNAELHSLHAWLRHPVRSMIRLIPLRLKERVNHAAGRPVFDLAFYLKFQPRSVLSSHALVEPLRYMPPPAARRRIALITPHLGPGGAESVLFEAARALDRAQCETFLIATQSHDAQWRPRWEQAVDHVYDLAALVKPGRMVAALYSMAINWEFQMIAIQNSLAGYSAIPHIRQGLPGVWIADLIHAVDGRWDVVSATGAVEGQIDVHVVISEAARQRLLRAGVPESKVRLIRNGIDLQRFEPVPEPPGSARKTILFAGRLDPVKRPLLLVDIAAELARLRPQRDFQFLVAGDGPESASLRDRVKRSGLLPHFTLLGHVEDMPALLREVNVVIVPSQAEGIPLIVLEAFAMRRAVVCARVGAAGEAVDRETGVLIEPGREEAGRFAAALHALLDDPDRRREMGARARRKVEREYSREQAQRAYRDLFAQSRR